MPRPCASSDTGLYAVRHTAAPYYTRLRPVCPANQIDLTAGQIGRGSKQEFPPGLFGGGKVMRKSEAIEFHEREAARCRRLLASATTPALRARLTEQAREHERLAAELSEELVLADA